MKRTGTPDPIVVVRAHSDDDLNAMIHVRAAADPQSARPRLDNLRHNLAGNPDLAYLVARVQDAPVGCGFVDVSHASAAARGRHRSFRPRFRARTYGGTGGARRSNPCR